MTEKDQEIKKKEKGNTQQETLFGFGLLKERIGALHLGFLVKRVGVGGRHLRSVPSPVLVTRVTATCHAGDEDNDGNDDDQSQDAGSNANRLGNGDRRPAISRVVLHRLTVGIGLYIKLKTGTSACRARRFRTNTPSATLSGHTNTALSVIADLEALGTVSAAHSARIVLRAKRLTVTADAGGVSHVAPAQVVGGRTSDDTETVDLQSARRSTVGRDAGANAAVRTVTAV